MIMSDTEDDEPPKRCAECDELFCDLFQSRGADDGSFLCHHCYGDENYAELGHATYLQYKHISMCVNPLDVAGAFDRLSGDV